MIHAVVAILFLALPIAAWVLKRSLAWVAAALIAGLSISGALVSVANYAGYRWTWTSLELLLVATFVVVVVAAWATRPRGGERPSIRHQWWAIGLPMVVVGACVVISRLLAAPSSGLFTGVGFFMRRIYAEDNAKWLDFTSRLVQGEQIVQSDPLGGPLQLFLVPVADLLSTVSLIAFGGINEVFVMSNTVIYGQFGLAILAAAALAPVAERAFRSSTGGGHLPLPLVWTGAGIITIASLAASGLGHLTLQFTFLVVGLWVAAFLVRAPATVTSLASLAVVPLFLVWFPMAPVSAVVVIAAIAFAVAMIVRRQRNTPWVLLGLWGITIGLVASDLLRVLSFLTDNASVNASQALGAAGAVAAGVGANSLNLNFLSSQGGTEEATAISGALAAVGALGAAIFLGLSIVPIALIAHWLAAGLSVIGIAFLMAFGSTALTLFHQELVRPDWRAAMSGASMMTMGFGWGLVASGGGFFISAWGWTAFFLTAALLTACAAAAFWLYFVRNGNVRML